MNIQNDTSRFLQSIKGLNQRLYAYLIRIPEDVQAQVQEIRLRVNRPIALYCAKRMYYITDKCQISTAIMADKMLTVTIKDVTETFQNICGYSVYSRQNEIKNGFITMVGGHRAGICGTAVYANNELSNIKDISSINIRVARQINGAADDMLNKVEEISKGVLICGSPASGKTTVLRDLARQLSTEYNKKIVVVDERGELAGTYRGEAQNDLGQADVLNGYDKHSGIMHALRCLSPDIVICDEVGSFEDAVAIEECLNAGVTVVASIHAGGKQALLKRPQAKRLIETGAFEEFVFLKNRSQPGEIKEVCKREVLENAQVDRADLNDCQYIMGRRLAIS